MTVVPFAGMRGGPGRLFLLGWTLLASCGEGAALAPDSSGSDQPAAGQAGSPATADDDLAWQLETLEAIGYGGAGEIASERTGVLVHDRDRAAPGANLVLSNHAPEAVLMDMQGEKLHAWSRSLEEVFGMRAPAKDFWRSAHVFPNGDCLAIFDGIGLVKLDRGSNVLWAVKNRAHHALFVDETGDIHVLTRKRSTRPEVSDGWIIEDFIVTLDAGGAEKERVSLVDAFLRSERYRGILEGRQERISDLLHSNTLRVLDGSAAAANAEFRAGRVLTSMRSLNAICLVDLGLGEVVWAHQGGYLGQHDPALVAGGRLLLFDNRGLQRRRSRILELDLRSMEVVWSHGEAPGEEFFSLVCGAVSRLWNGNTLITESTAGRAFEVTPDGATVWEFVSPHRHPEHPDRTAMLFEVRRLEERSPLDWIEGR